MRQQLHVAFFIAFVGLIATSQDSWACGGTERWAVKVAADPLAPNIDPSPIATTVADLNQTERPQALPMHHGSDIERQAEEMKVYRIKGFIAFCRFESGATGDGDFHIALTDDDSSPISIGPNITSTSMVVEIPNPKCIAGRDDTVKGQSRFGSRIAQARATFESHMTGLCGHVLTDRVPVTVTGVGFFDFDHNQTGRAQNLMELHPVIGIEFGN